MIFLYLIRFRMTLRIWVHLEVIYQKKIKKKNIMNRKRLILLKWQLALTFSTKLSKSLLIKRNQNSQSKNNKRRMKRIVKQRINNFLIEKFKKDCCSMLSNVVLKMAFKIKKTKIIKKITKLIRFNLNKLRNQNSKSNHNDFRSQTFHLVFLMQILILKMKIWFCFQHIQRVSSTKMVKMSFLKTK